MEARERRENKVGAGTILRCSRTFAAGAEVVRLNPLCASLLWQLRTCRFRPATPRTTAVWLACQPHGAAMKSRSNSQPPRTHNSAPTSLLEMETARNEATSLAERVGEISPDDNRAAAKLQDAAVTLSQAADLVHEAMVDEAVARDEAREGHGRREAA